MDAPQQYRSNMPCDNIDKVPLARRILQHYQTLLPFHTRGRAMEEVIGRLNDGEAADELLMAAVAYAKFLALAGTSPRYGASATTFYSLAGEWERFRDGVVPELPAEPDQRDPGWRKAKREEAERRANMERVKAEKLSPEEAQAARERWRELRRKT